MKKITALILALALILSCGAAMAKSKKMDVDLPKWNEENVRQYAMDYIEGKSMERLWSYYDLQLRRYMPLESFSSQLIDLEFLTGKFVSMGSYRCFEEPNLQLKVHVIHLNMEKQDLDMYFTHKDQEDDWEVMAVEFVPAEREEIADSQMLVDSEPYRAPSLYTDYEVTIGSKYPLVGTLSVPNEATAENPVPVCVLIHKDGAMDRDLTVGETAIFADIAEIFGDMGIAVLRYDKRSYTYPDAPVETVEDEVIEDAVSALKLLSDYEELDQKNIFLFGIGFGGTLIPRIASESGVSCRGMIVASATLRSKLEVDYDRLRGTVSGSEAEEVKDLVRNLKNWREDKARGTEIFGRNGYYYWEMLQNNRFENLVRKLGGEWLFIHSKQDELIDREEGFNQFKTRLGKSSHYTFLEFRNENHLLMKDLHKDETGVVRYDYPAHLDKQSGRDIANWILSHCK